MCTLLVFGSSCQYSTQLYCLFWDLCRVPMHCQTAVQCCSQIVAVTSFNAVRGLFAAPKTPALTQKCSALPQGSYIELLTSTILAWYALPHYALLHDCHDCPILQRKTAKHLRIAAHRGTLLIPSETASSSSLHPAHYREHHSLCLFVDREL